MTLGKNPGLSVLENIKLNNSSIKYNLIPKQDLDGINLFKEEMSSSIKNETSEKVSNLKMSISITNKLDHLIDGIFSDTDSIKTVLMELRIGISGYEKNKIFLSGAAGLQEFLDLFEKSFNGPLSLEEYSMMTLHYANVLRYIPHYSVEILTNYIKSGTSEQIYELGPKDAPFETYLEDKIIGSSFIPDSIERVSLSYAKIPGAVIAGGIDGTLDFLKGYVDLRTIPDKAMSGLYDVIKNIPDELSELGNIILLEGGKDIAPDISYILSYIASIIYFTFTIDPGAGILAIPKALGNMLTKVGIPATKIVKIQEYFSLHGKKIQEKLMKNSPKIDKTLNSAISGERIGQGFNNITRSYGKADTLKSSINNTDTLAKQMMPVKEAVILSRSVLKGVNNSMLLAGVFSNDIQQVLGVGKNTSIALSIYKNNLDTFKNKKDNIKEKENKNKFLILNDLDNMINESSGELKYNLLRIKERFEEVEKILNEQVKPIYKEYKNILESGTKNELSEFKAKIKADIESKGLYDELSKTIIDNYINKN